ncbi:PaaI family thioesterase [Dactylosporangium sp. NPDC005572]|uniref:PaaI family thioesterase n=1 Tax=Dactylosporangium sp. NPDC005572 TaxID=3156889 RepID=UPI0033B42D43
MTSSPESAHDRVPLAPFWQQWSDRAAARAPAGWTGLIDELRDLQDTAAASAPPAEAVARATTLLAHARRLLAAHTVADDEQLYGKLLRLPGRGQTLSPPLRLVSWTATEIVGEVTFGRFHSGSNDAVHGGAVALLFDEALGRLSDLADRPPSRTVSLRVEFRSLTPVGRPLTVRARLLGQDGRKRRLAGVLRDGERLCAEADGLFLALRPGQR